MNDPVRKVWNDLLDVPESKGAIVSQDDIDDAISLLIDMRIDPDKFIGNLRALLSGGRGYLSIEEWLFPEKTYQNPRTRSMTDEFIFGRSPEIPLWILAAFPDVVNWLNEKMRILHRASKCESDELKEICALWGIDLGGSADFDERACRNKDGQLKVRYYRNLIDNYVKDTGNTLETAVEHGSPNDIYAGFNLLQSLGEESNFTLIASMTTKYYMELTGRYGRWFPDETAVIAASGIIDANHYIRVTQQITPEEIVRLARETQGSEDRFVDFVKRFVPLVVAADAPEFPAAMVLEACDEQSEAIEHAIGRTLNSYTGDAKIATGVRVFMESAEFSELRKPLHLRGRQAAARITTAESFAIELKDYISMHALAKKELKSLAESIEYSLGVFKIGNRLRLRQELVFLYAFLGASAIRICFRKCNNVEQGVVDTIVEVYTKKLISQWLPRSAFSDYEDRLAAWTPLFDIEWLCPEDEAEAMDGAQAYAEAMGQLARTFYEFLTGRSCDAMKELMLGARFNKYMENFIIGIHGMAAISEC